MSAGLDRRAVVLAGLAAGAAPARLASAASDRGSACTTPAITEAQFRAYIDAFNRGDHESYTGFYAPDVTLNVVGKIKLNGAAAVIAFYSQVRATAQRTILVDRIDFGPDVMAVRLRSEFLGLADDPDFVAGPLKRGDRIAIRTFVIYNLENGRFKRIRSAEFSKTRPARAPA